MTASLRESILGPMDEQVLERARQRVAEARTDGIAREVVPVSRSLAEIRGGVNQALRRLERLEEELLAERNARIDDLAILVDLVSAGWSGVDRRLKRLEDGIEGAVVPLPTGRDEETLSPAERAAVA